MYDHGLISLLHWLDVPERVQYKLCALCNGSQGTTVHKTHCVHTSVIVRRQHLRSAG